MKRISAIPFVLILFTMLNMIPGTGCYSFREKGTIPDSIKTVRINFIQNRAAYQNPQLSPSLTERLKQKIITQTRLRQTDADDAHYDINGYVSDYTASTVGVTSNNGRSESSTNRLTVSVHMILTDQLNNTTKEFDVSRQMDFPASKSLQEAEATLLEEMIRNLTDEIFNHIFSDW